MSSKNSFFKSLIKVLISLFLLIVVYRAINLQKLLEALAHVSIKNIFFIAGVYAFGQILSAVKWKIFLSQVGHRESFPKVVLAYFIGMFFNTFGLGTIGGDLARALALKPAKEEFGKVLSTVIADRVHGLGMLVLLLAVAVSIMQPIVLGSYAAFISFFVFIVFLLGWWFGYGIFKKYFPFEGKLKKAGLTVLTSFPKKKGAFLLASVVSLVFHCSQVYAHWLIAVELGAKNLSLGYLFATVPLVNILSSLPISFGGLGLRENLYPLLFAPMDVAKEVAVAFGSMWFLIITLVSVIVGIFIGLFLVKKRVWLFFEKYEENN